VADVLSQKEIDLLLSALSSGEVNPDEIKKEQEENKVRVYDFKRPNKLSKDHISTLRMIYENYARTVSNYLTGQLRTNVNLTISSVEQLTYEEFIRSIPNPTILCSINIEEMKGRFFLEMNPSFGFQVIDILCGGMAKETSRKNEFTDIELVVVQEVLETMTRVMKFSWEEIIDITPEIESIEKNPQLEQSIPPNESIALITFNTDIAKKTSFINLCIPYLSLEQVIHRLSVHSWFESEKRGGEQESFAGQIGGKLNSVEADLLVELGRTRLNIRDFIHLTEGDVIQLDQPIAEPLQVFVENRLKFLGYLGTSRNRMAVKIAETVEEDVDTDE